MLDVIIMRGHRLYAVQSLFHARILAAAVQ
jgi:hypothetical protein